MRSADTVMLAFTLLMIHSPLLFVALYRPRGVRLVSLREDRTLGYRLAGLAGGTLLADAAVAIAWYWQLDYASWAWALFFPLWFGGAMPWLWRRYPALRTPHPNPDAVRVASLKPRRPPMARRAWHLQLAVWCGVLVLLLALWSWRRQELGEQSLTALLLTISSAASAVITWLAGVWTSDQAGLEPCPLPTEGSERAEAEWEDWQRTKARLMFGCSSLIPALFASCALAVLLGAPLWVVIAVGAGGGTLVGLLGAALGIWAGTRQARFVQRAAEPAEEGPQRPAGGQHGGPPGTGHPKLA